LCAQASSGTYPPPATADRKSRGPECGFLRFPLISVDQTSEIHALQKSMPNCWHPSSLGLLSCFALGLPSPRHLARAQVPYVHHLSALGWPLSQDQDVGRRKSGATRFCGAFSHTRASAKMERFSFLSAECHGPLASKKAFCPLLKSWPVCPSGGPASPVLSRTLWAFGNRGPLSSAWRT